MRRDQRYVASTAIILDGVAFDGEAEIQDFVTLGAEPRDGRGDRITRIGARVVIRSNSVIYAGVTLGERAQTGHGVLIREDTQVGRGSSVGSHSVIEFNVSVGCGVRIHSNVFLPEYTRIEDDAWIGPCVCVTNAKYPWNPLTKSKLAGVLIRSGAIVGAAALLLPGVEIGERALVGAGAIVVNDVPPGKVVLGAPARVVRDVAEIPDYAVRSLED